eukprot:3842762-Rhodomonas_salina.3
MYEAEQMVGAATRRACADSRAAPYASTLVAQARAHAKSMGPRSMTRSIGSIRGSGRLGESRRSSPANTPSLTPRTTPPDASSLCASPHHLTAHSATRAVNGRGGQKRVVCGCERRRREWERRRGGGGEGERGEGGGTFSLPTTSRSSVDFPHLGPTRLMSLPLSLMSPLPFLSHSHCILHHHHNTSRHYPYTFNHYHFFSPSHHHYTLSHHSLKSPLLSALLHHKLLPLHQKSIPLYLQSLAPCTTMPNLTTPIPFPPCP